jgi:hypothetical protein
LVLTAQGSEQQPESPHQPQPAHNPYTAGLPQELQNLAEEALRRLLLP